MLEALTCEKDSADASASVYTREIDRGALLYPTLPFNRFVLLLETRVAFFLTSENYVRFQDRLIPSMQAALLKDAALRQS